MSRRSRRWWGGVRGAGEQGSQIVCERYDGREPLSVREWEGEETEEEERAKLWECLIPQGRERCCVEYKVTNSVCTYMSDMLTAGKINVHLWPPDNPAEILLPFSGTECAASNQRRLLWDELQPFKTVQLVLFQKLLFYSKNNCFHVQRTSENVGLTLSLQKYLRIQNDRV